jgi:hypothetical protein
VRIEIEAPGRIREGDNCPLRALLFNDSYLPIVVSRNAFIGPGVRERTPDGPPEPLAVEPTYGHEEDLFTLHPFSFYGRERSVGPLPAGEVEVTASYRSRSGVMITASKRLRVEAD